MAEIEPSTKRLASLVADEHGICDCTNFTTYAGGHIPRDPAGCGLMFAEVNGPIVDRGWRRDGWHRSDLYESLCIRLTGGFDD